MRITVDLAKASTEPVDLTGVLNPRVGDGDLKLPFHLMYNGDDYDMRGKGMDFLSEGADQKKIHVSGTVDESTKGDDPYTGNVTFTFPTGTFKTPGAYDVDKTMFRVINNDDHSVISTVNVKMNILPNDSDVQSSDDVSYDSRMEKIMKDYSDKGQASLDDAKQKAQQIIDDANKQATDYLNGVKKQGEDLLNEIKQTNSEAKGNVAGDTAATAKQAKQLANDNSGKIHDLQGEVGDARGRFMTLNDRENKQDFNIDRKEDKANANANYAAQDLRNDKQDAEIAKKANVSFITDYLSKMHLQPESFENADALKAKYPAGKAGIMVAADTGHMWIWVNDEWKDCGAYQSAGYPEVDEARVGAESLGEKKYTNLSEAIHRQIDGLSNLGNQAFSYPVSGLIGQQVSLKSEWEVGIQSGSTLRVKFDLKDESDLSVIQVYANGAWFASIESQNFGTWQKFKLDKDIGTLGLVIPDDKFSNNFNAEISFQVITAPVSDLQTSLNQLRTYSIPISLSPSEDELKPKAIDNIDFDQGSKIYIRLKSMDGNPKAIKNYQFIANGHPVQTFKDINNWHEVTLPDVTTSLGFICYKESVTQNLTGVLQIAGQTMGNVYRDFDTDNQNIIRNLSQLINLNLPISASPSTDDVSEIAANNLSIPKGTKIRVKFSTDNPGLVEGYQIWANGKFLISYNDANVWHEITLPNDTTSLGYAFPSKRVHGNLTGNLEILGESFNKLYSLVDGKIDEQAKNGLNPSLIGKLKQKEEQINTITNGITHGVNFIFMTDPHFPDNDLLSKPMMEHVLDHTSIPFVICGGDFPGAFGTKDQVLDAANETLDYQNYIGKNRFFTIQGNHDFTIRKSPTENTGWTASNSLVYDTLIRPNEAYQPSIQAGKEYYYLDVLPQKTRIFMLNSMDGNPAAENTDPWGTQYTISQDQADWLVEKAKEKVGWKFIFVCHVPCDSNLDSYNPNEEYFHKVASAINNKQQLDFHAGSINESADFTGTTNQVVAILAGHNHVDQSSSKDGVLSISTTSDARYGDGGWDRQPQLYTSPAFDVVSIDYDKGTINTTRIGGGQDRAFSYVAPNQGEKINSLRLRPVDGLTVNGTAKCVVDMATPVVPEAIEWSNKCFAWSSSDSAVAEVNASGVITAHTSGTATITVSTRDGRYSDHCNVIVK